MLAGLQAVVAQALKKFNKIVDHIQKKLNMEGKEVPTKSQMIENALFQGVAAIHTFQAKLRGMHNDLHPENLMLKYCDDSLYGPPGEEKPLNQVPHAAHRSHRVQLFTPW